MRWRKCALTSLRMKASLANKYSNALKRSARLLKNVILEISVARSICRTLMCFPKSMIYERRCSSNVLISRSRKLDMIS